MYSVLQSRPESALRVRRKNNKDTGCQLHHNPPKSPWKKIWSLPFLVRRSPLSFSLRSLVLSCSPFSSPLPSFLSVPSSMLNENQTFGRPNQDVLSWMSLIMGWVNSEFRCCRGIKSRDKPGLIERNDTDIEQWTLVRWNYLLMCEEEEQNLSWFWMESKTWGLVNKADFVL